MGVRWGRNGRDLGELAVVLASRWAGLEVGIVTALAGLGGGLDWGAGYYGTDEGRAGARGKCHRDGEALLARAGLLLSQE